MSEEQQFCLRWNNFQVNITSQFEALRDDEDFVDVTLACEGKRLKAHKVVLSACSPYFKDLFKSNPCKHPILFMRDVEFHHLQSLVEFMYAGEVNIAQAQLSAFLRTAESLQIRGLTEAPQRHKQMDSFSSSGSQGRMGSRQAASPGGGSQAPSPEEADQDGEEEVMSLSPPSSPPPVKKACLSSDKAGVSEQMDESGSHNRTSHGDHYDNIKRESIDFVEPKVEAPDYCSDGEGKGDVIHTTPQMYQGMENSVDMTQSFSGLQGGGMEILPGTSAQNYIGDASQDSGQVTPPVVLGGAADGTDGGGGVGGGGSSGAGLAAEGRGCHLRWEMPRPCPVCRRIYSNNSNLRRHMKSAHLTRKSGQKTVCGNIRYKYSLAFPSTRSPYQSVPTEVQKPAPVPWTKSEEQP